MGHFIKKIKRSYMKKTNYKVNLFIAIAFFLLLGCSNSKPEEAESTTTPTKLVVTINIVGATTQNPNGDGSGKVNFSISATDAIKYKIDFGNGETKEVTNGNFYYTYTAAGANTYVIRISAYNGLKFISTIESLVVFVKPTLVWSDEFETDGAPNSSKWAYDLGAGGWGNNESQYYTNRPENVIVKGGLLKINTIKENFLGSNYTSARILTKGKFSVKYGKIEFKAKLPSGGGTWPALWMLGNNIDTTNWPACGEIDIMEHIGNQQNKIFSTLHFPGHSGANGNGSNIMIANASTEFHIYTVDWRANLIQFYIDNNLYFTFSNSTDLPFNHDFFLIINCAIGGGFGGTITHSFTSSTFEIDYVRVYN
jgi:beta-glucanase (GH16 family)